MIKEVSEKLLGQFVDSLEAKLTAYLRPTLRRRRRRPGWGPTPQAPAAEPAPIDLLELAGGSMLKKYGPAALGVLAVLHRRPFMGRKVLRRRP